MWIIKVDDGPESISKSEFTAHCGQILKPQTNQIGDEHLNNIWSRFMVMSSRET